MIDFQASFAVVFFSEEQISVFQSQKTKRFAEIFLERLGQIQNGVSIVSNFAFTDFEKANLKILEASSELEFFKKLLPILPPSKSNDPIWDEVFFYYFNGLSPLVDVELTKELEKRHKEYFCQYSYSENLPPGIVPVMMSREFLNTLPKEWNAAVHEFFFKNINSYDVEIFYEPPDLRQMRLDFTLHSNRSFFLCQDLLDLDPQINYKSLPKLLQENPIVFRKYPSYVELEIHRGCENKCSFCPRQGIQFEKDNTSLSKEDIQKIFDSWRWDFPKEVTVCIGGLGEPLLHSELKEILETIASKSFVGKIYLETSLYPPIDSLKNFLSTSQFASKFEIIVNISTFEEASYQKIYESKTPLKVILEKIEMLSALHPKNKIHLQMIKIKELEAEIEAHFDLWEKKGFSVILQKYNSFANRLPEKRVSNLVPIQREFCWHLTREVYINADGGVSVCRQDFNKSIGNILTEGFEAIWKKNSENFLSSFKGEHDKVSAPCLNCDEWYTFQG